MVRTRRRLKGLRKTLRGGDIIAEGASSYVIYPAPKCKNKNTTNYVARLSKTKNLRNLITKTYPSLITLLKKIDPSQKYFYYPETCNVTDISSENKEDGITNSNKKFIEIVRKGGDKWFDWRNLDKWKDPNAEELNHLRKAIDLLHENKIVHGDLHGDNIIIAEDGLPRIIDFTQAVTDAPDDYIKQEEDFVKRGWPTLEYYKVYESDTVEGKKINDIRKKIRSELLKTRRKLK